MKLFGWGHQSEQQYGDTVTSAINVKLFWPAVVALLICLTILGVQGWIEWRARNTQVQETESSLANLASSLIQDAEDTIEIADTAVASVVAQLEIDGTSPEGLTRLNPKLAVQIAAEKRFADLVVLGPDGDWIATSASMKPGNFADRVYFRHHRDDPDPGAFVGPPVGNRLNGDWIITVSRRFRSATGGFGGVVLATVALSHFVDRYETYNLGPNGSIALTMTDGTLLARYPETRSSVGRNVLNSTSTNHLAEQPAGSFLNNSSIDGVRRFVGYNQSVRYPLLVFAAMSEDQALSAWRVDMRIHTLIAFILTAAIGLLGLHLIRQMGRSHAAEQRVRESEARYRLIADNINDVIIQAGPDGRWRYVSPSSQRVIGLSSTALLGSRTLDFVHPDDRQAMLDRIERLHEGKPEEQRPTFRIMRRDGTEISLEASSQVVFHPVTGKQDGYVSVLRNVTEQVAMETALRDSEKRYRLLADNATDMIFVLDREFTRRYVSPGCRELLGYLPEELVGISLVRMIHPDDAERVAAICRELFTGLDRAETTNRVHHRDGHWIWVEATFRLVRDPVSGAPLEICGALRDITQRRKAEIALRESEERYHLLLQSGGVTEAIYMLDANGNVESWNASAERIKGYTAAEIIGRNFATFFTPEDVEAGEPARALATARDTGQFITEVWRMRKDGSRFLAHVTIDAVRRDDGTIRGFADVTHDITNQRVEEEQRAIIIEAAPNGMMIIDEIGMITLANSQVGRLFDYPNGTLVGQPVEILVPGLRVAHEALCSGIGSSRDGRVVATGQEFIGHKRDGSAVAIEILLSPVKTPRGRIVVVSLFDITERQRQVAEQQEAEKRERLKIEATNASLDRLSQRLTKARDRAEQANRAKSRFLAGMSHELRTPLNGILGYAQLLHMEGGLSTTQSARVDAMLGAGKHLLEMITCVLDLSEIEAEHIVLRNSEVDMQAIASASLDLVRPTAEAKGLALSLAVTPGTPRRLVVDPTRLRQILLNLLGNAVKFTAQGKVELRLRTVADGSMLRIEVTDTGQGIPPEQRQRLFQDFERLDTEATEKAEGAGLGLALSARLVALMGGRLNHEDNPAGGSVFWLELPSNTPVAADQALPETKDERDAEPAPLGALHVLVADDVLMNRDIAEAFLRKAGHIVTSVEGGAEAVAVAASIDLDVVLMDVRMPEVDGLEATRRIRALEGPHGLVPIVALTAQAFTDQVAECRRAGMDSHLAKPFDQDALLAAVARAVRDGQQPRRDVNPVVTAIPVPAAPENSEVGADLPVFDLQAFDRTAAFLSPEAVASYLRTIATITETLLQGLRAPDASMRHQDLAGAAHKLAGSASMFGFERLADLARRFETAVQSGGSEASILAIELCTVLKFSLVDMKKLIGPGPLPAHANPGRLKGGATDLNLIAASFP